MAQLIDMADQKRLANQFATSLAPVPLSKLVDWGDEEMLEEMRENYPKAPADNKIMTNLRLTHAELGALKQIVVEYRKLMEQDPNAPEKMSSQEWLANTTPLTKVLLHHMGYKFATDSAALVAMTTGDDTTLVRTTLWYAIKARWLTYRRRPSSRRQRDAGAVPIQPMPTDD